MRQRFAPPPDCRFLSNMLKPAKASGTYATDRHPPTHPVHTTSQRHAQTKGHAMYIAPALPPALAGLHLLHLVTPPPHTPHVTEEALQPTNGRTATWPTPPPCPPAQRPRRKGPRRHEKPLRLRYNLAHVDRDAGARQQRAQAAQEPAAVPPSPVFRFGRSGSVRHGLCRSGPRRRRRPRVCGWGHGRPMG